MKTRYGVLEVLNDQESRVYFLRLQGLVYREIAEDMDRSTERARQVFMKAERKLRKANRQFAENMNDRNN